MLQICLQYCIDVVVVEINSILYSSVCVILRSHALAQRLQEEEDGRTAAAGPDMAYQQPDRHASDQARSHLSPGGASPGRGTPVHGGKAPARDRKKDNAVSVIKICCIVQLRIFHGVF